MWKWCHPWVFLDMFTVGFPSELFNYLQSTSCVTQVQHKKNMSCWRSLESCQFPIGIDVGFRGGCHPWESPDSTLAYLHTLAPLSHLCSCGFRRGRTKRRWTRMTPLISAVLGGSLAPGEWRCFHGACCVDAKILKQLSWFFQCPCQMSL